jgi:hypothetical protein
VGGAGSFLGDSAAAPVLRATARRAARVADAVVRPTTAAPDFGVHVYLQESEPGRPVHLSAGIAGPLGQERQAPLIVGVDHELEWEKGPAAPTLMGGSISRLLHGGDRVDLELTAMPGRAQQLTAAGEWASEELPSPPDDESFDSYQQYWEALGNNAIRTLKRIAVHLEVHPQDAAASTAYRHLLAAL